MSDLNFTTATRAPVPAQPGHILVIGGGLAGIRSANALRERGFSGEITLIADEPGEAYDRPPLSKELFTRTGPAPLAEQNLGLRPGAARVLQPARVLSLQADDAGVQATVVGADIGRAEELDEETGDIHPAAGSLGAPAGSLGAPADPAAEPVLGAQFLTADLAILATGATAVLPPSLAGAQVLRTAADADALRTALTTTGQSAHLVIIGAGWVGCEVASSAAAHGVRVTVLEAGPAPLWAQVGARLSERLRPWFAAAGVDLRTETSARAVTRSADGHVVRLADGTTLTADAVLVAVGARAATSLLGQDVTRDDTGAVLVHPDGRPIDGPSALRVVGDAATIVLPEGGQVPGGHWDGALHHPTGVVAAIMGGEPGTIPAASTFSTMFGHDLHALGAPAPLPDDELIIREDAQGWTALTLREGRLIGVVTVDHPRDISPLRKALAGGARPQADPVALADTAIPLKKALR